MAFHVRDAEADRLLRNFADARGVGLTEAIKLAVQEAVAAEKQKLSLWERLKPIQDRIASYPATGFRADKAFYDSLNDE